MRITLNDREDGKKELLFGDGICGASLTIVFEKEKDMYNLAIMMKHFCENSQIKHDVNFYIDAWKS